MSKTEFPDDLVPVSKKNSQKRPLAKECNKKKDQCKFDLKYQKNAYANCQVSLEKLNQKVFSRFLRKQKAALKATRLEDKIHMKSSMVKQFIKVPVEKVWLDVVRRVTLLLTVNSVMRACMGGHENFTKKSMIHRYQFNLSSNPLSFDTAAYKAAKSLNVNAHTISICRRSPKSRNEVDLRAVYSALSEFPVFNRCFSVSERLSLCKYMQYMKKDEKSIITHFNRTPINIYFLFSGEINVFDRGQENNVVFESQKRLSLRKGAYFSNKKKTELCVCSEECELFYIEKKIFNRLGLNRVFEVENEKMFNFFRSWPPLCDWSDNAIYDLVEVSIFNQASNRSLLLKDHEEDKSKVLWFVMEGTIDVVKITGLEPCLKLLRKTYLPSIVNHNTDGIFIKSNYNRMYPLKECGKWTSRPASNNLKSIFEPSNETETAFSSLRTFTPIFLRVHQLQANESYGLGKLKIADFQDCAGRFCLIGNRCTFIQTSVEKMKELIAVLGINIANLKEESVVYPSDYVIAEKVKNKIAYKKIARKLIKNFYDEKKNAHQYSKPR